MTVPTIEGVIFDLGSTLIRFRGNWIEVQDQGRRAAAASLVSSGLPLPAEAFADGLHEAFRRNFEERRKDHRERASRVILREVLAAHGVSEVAEDDVREALRRLYAPSESCWSAVPGVLQVLGEVSAMGMRLGLLSNASDVENVERLMAGARLNGHFDPVVVSAAAGVRKPTPTLFLDIVRGWDLNPDAVVMVGDMLAEDILGAQRAGLRQIWVRAEADPAFNDEYIGKIVPEVAVESLGDVPAAIRTFRPASG